jgi:hypothetical protein
MLLLLLVPHLMPLFLSFDYLFLASLYRCAEFIPNNVELLKSGSKKVEIFVVVAACKSVSL